MNTTATAAAKVTDVRPASLPVEVPGAEGRVQCRCSTDCKAVTWNLFAQGHDARLVSRLVDAVVNPATAVDLPLAVAMVQRAGGDDRLVSKLVTAVGTAHDRWMKRQEANERKARRAASPRKVTAKVGRWQYQGTVAGGKFSYKTKSGDAKVTTKFSLV